MPYPMLAFIWALLSLVFFSAPAAAGPAPDPLSRADAIAGLTGESDAMFQRFMADAHIPGMVYAIVADGRLVHVKAFGVADVQSRRAVTADTRFRIASMTKAFTALGILSLRDEGRLSLSDRAETHVPKMCGWAKATPDSRAIRLDDLLHHIAGLVTDDPWGDRQQPLPEAEFSAMLAAGVPFQRAPGLAYEYSNFGYAVLGRVISNVSGTPWNHYIQNRLLRPLGMRDSGFDPLAGQADQRAIGYRYRDARWEQEPVMPHGAFGAMGGLQTTANDYARYVAWLLSAWPARDGGQAGPLARSTMREIIAGSGFPRVRMRPGTSGPCQQALSYGMGFHVAIDCDLGLTLSHGGGYPGYGSHVVLLPEAGIGIFAFANRTYAGAAVPVWDTAMLLSKAGLTRPAAVPASPALIDAYAAARRIWTKGEVEGERLAMNMLMDSPAEDRARHYAQLKERVGECDTSADIRPTGQLSGDFRWTCSRADLAGTLLLSPARPPAIQALRLFAVERAADTRH